MEWIEDAEFAGWLDKFANDEYFCLCTVCNSQLRCGKSELRKHAATEKHKKKQG